MSTDHTNCSVFHMQVATLNAQIFIDEDERTRAREALAQGQQPEINAGAWLVHMGNATEEPDPTPIKLQIIEDLSNPGAESYRVKLTEGEILPGPANPDEAIITAPRRQICYPGRSDS